MKRGAFIRGGVAAGALSLLAACGGGTSATVAAVTAAVSAGAGLTSFTFHSATAYWANFGAAGVALSGATSSAASGGSIASYSWEQISGPAVTFTSDLASQTVTFDVPAMTAILHDSDQYRWQALPISRDDALAVFRLTATDAAGNSDVATFTVYLFDAGSEIKPSTGIQNVGIGEKVYLSGPSWKANASVASTAVTDWSWAIAAPAGSAAALGSGTAQITSFTPDVEGTYTITYASTSAEANGTLTINASTYVGVGTIAGTTPDEDAGQCGACHDGSQEPDRVTEWEATGHASMFEQTISSYKARAPRPYCWECHTVGYDTSVTAHNGGFYDLVNSSGYNFPSAGTTWDQFVADNPTLAPLTNVQCENCHGPGGAHRGDVTNSRTVQSVWNAGICGKCHPQETEWKAAAHNSTGVKSNRGAYRLTAWRRASCARCHTTGGFIQHAAGEAVAAQSDTEDIGVTCVACHSSHSVAADAPSGPTSASGNNSTQLRLKGTVTMQDDAGTEVDAGKAAVCYSCHDGYYVKGEVDCDADGDGTLEAVCQTVDQVATQYFRQIHHNNQSFVLEGVGAVTHFSDSAYDFTLTENSFHSSSLFTLAHGSGDSSLSDENDKCVTCHMGTAPTSEEEGYRLVGGHTWKVVNGSDEFLKQCRICHPGLASVNRTARADYDSDGSVEGIQDEISGLLLALSDKIKAIDPTNVTGGESQGGDGSITVAQLSYASQAKMNASPIDVRRAVYNHNIVANDGSRGAHNAAFSVQLIQKTYTAISGLNGGRGFEEDFPSAVIR